MVNAGCRNGDTGCCAADVAPVLGRRDDQPFTAVNVDRAQPGAGRAGEPARPQQRPAAHRGYYSVAELATVALSVGLSPILPASIGRYREASSAGYTEEFTVIDVPDLGDAAWASHRRTE